MKRKKPMLVITLQIPLSDELTAEDVLESLREQTEMALQLVRERLAGGYDERDMDGEASEEPMVAMAGLETLEPFSDETRDDILDKLGYRESE